VGTVSKGSKVQRFKGSKVGFKCSRMGVVGNYSRVFLSNGHHIYFACIERVAGDNTCNGGIFVQRIKGSKVQRLGLNVVGLGAVGN
jgi:hypothetical protein